MPISRYVRLLYSTDFTMVMSLVAVSARQKTPARLRPGDRTAAEPARCLLRRFSECVFRGRARRTDIHPSCADRSDLPTPHQHANGNVTRGVVRLLQQP